MKKLSDMAYLAVAILLVVALALIIAAMAFWMTPARASWLPSQQWSWRRNSEPDVALYRLYWGARPQVSGWCPTLMREFHVETSCGIAAGCPSDSECCGDLPMPTRPLIFFVVTAIDASGNESGTGHAKVGTICP
jgi:hypothetical protein